MRIISSIAFMEDGSVVLVWMDSVLDVRNEGKLIASHQIHVRGTDGKDYGDEIDAVRLAAAHLLADALDDFASTDANEG